MTRYLVELSVATGIGFEDLAGLPAPVLATYSDVLAKGRGKR